MTVRIKGKFFLAMWFLGVVALECSEPDKECAYLLDGSVIYEAGPLSTPNVHSESWSLAFEEPLGLNDEVCYSPLQQNLVPKQTLAKPTPSPQENHCGLLAQKESLCEETEHQWDVVQMSAGFCNTLTVQNQKLLRVWEGRRGEWFNCDELFPSLLKTTYNKQKGPAFYIKPLLGLVLDGVPIVYDKGAQQLMLAKEGLKRIMTPEPTKTLLSLIYDKCLLHKNLSLEECAYYAHEYGYWERGIKWHGGMKGTFYAYLEQCRWRLVVLGFLQKDALPKPVRGGMEAIDEVWRRIKQDGVVLEAKDYGSLVPPEDINHLKKLFVFFKSDAYQVLKNYVQSHTQNPLNRMKAFIRKCVQVDTYTQQNLLSFCVEANMGNRKLFWEAVHSLVSEKGPGHMIYNLEENVFCWDLGCRPESCPEEFLARIFVLKQAGFHSNLLTAVLKQEGFSVADHDMSRIYKCFSLLGIENDAQNIRQLRDLLNFMLKNETKRVLEEDIKGPILGENLRACRKAFAFAHEGKILRLLQVYGVGQEQFEKPKGTPPLKRKKMDISTPIKVIKNEIPALYNLLCRQVWSKQSGTNVDAHKKPL